MWLQVAFNVFIPCMLFSKVASTLATQPDISLLAIPLVAVLQVNISRFIATHHLLFLCCMLTMSCTFLAARKLFPECLLLIEE